MAGQRRSQSPRSLTSWLLLRILDDSVPFPGKRWSGEEGEWRRREQPADRLFAERPLRQSALLSQWSFFCFPCGFLSRCIDVYIARLKSPSVCTHSCFCCWEQDPRASISAYDPALGGFGEGTGGGGRDGGMQGGNAMRQVDGRPLDEAPCGGDRLLSRLGANLKNFQIAESMSRFSGGALMELRVGRCFFVGAFASWHPRINPDQSRLMSEV